MTNNDLNSKLALLKQYLTQDIVDVDLSNTQLQICFQAAKHQRVLKKLIEEGIFNLSTFWQLDFYLVKEIPQRVKVILCCIQAYEQELSKYDDFLDSLSLLEFLQICGSDIEKYNLLLKHRAKWTEKNYNSNPEQEELYRQSHIISIIELGLGFILRRRINKFLIDTTPKTKVTLKETEKIRECLNLAIQIDGLQETLELYLAGYCSISEISSTEIKLEPKGEIGLSVLKSNYTEKMKGRALLYATYYDIDPRIVLLLDQTVNLHYANMLEMYGEEKKEKIEKATVIRFLSHGIYLEEYSTFISRFFNNSPPKTIHLPNGNDVDTYIFLAIAAFLKALSQDYIRCLDDQWDNEVNKQMLPLELENWERRTAQKEIARLKNNRNALDKKIHELYQNKDFDGYIKKSIENINDAIDDKICLQQYDRKELIEFIHLGLGFTHAQISEILELLTFQHGDGFLLYTPLIEVGDKLCWLPNSVGYNVLGETLAVLAVSSPEIEVHEAQTKLYESLLTNLFKQFGYKVIEHEKDKFLYDNKNIISDFDTLAYKDGHIFHFEVKVTNFRQSPLAKEKWYNSKLEDAASRQIPRQREYIKNNEKKIREILQLPTDAEIKEIHSYIVSNASDYDDIEIKGYKKISISSLMILLLDLENLIYDEIDYFREIILRINNLSGTLIPDFALKWAKRLTPTSETGMDKIKALFANFIIAEREKLKNDPLHLKKYIDENIIFRQWDRSFKVIHQTKERRGYIVHKPQVVFYPIHGDELS